MPRGRPRTIELRSPDGTPQCTVTLGCEDGSTECPTGAATLAERQLNLWFHNPDQRKCSESFIDNTYCVGACVDPGDSLCPPAPGECEAEDDGAPKCGTTYYAKGPPIEPGVWHRICVEWKYTGRRVECALSQGPMPEGETESAVVEVGRRSMLQGACVGGPSAGHACGVDGDCPSSTCGNPSGVTVAAPDRVVVGVVSDAELDDGVVVHQWWDNLAVYDLAAGPTWSERSHHVRWLTLYPDGAGSSTCGNRSGGANCSSGPAIEWGCVRDTATGTCDGDTSHIACTVGETSDWTLSNLPGGITDCATDDSGPCIATDAPVVANCTARQFNQNTNGKPLRVRLRLSGVNDGGTTTDINGNSVWGNYSAVRPHVAHVAPGTLTWSVSRINSLGMGVFHAGESTVRTIRVSACATNVGYEIPPAPRACAFRDVNGNGRRTLVVVGDSILNGESLHAQLQSRALGCLDDVIECAEGRRQCRDFLDNITGIANGNANTAAITCKVLQGQAAPADVVMIGGCANDYLWAYGEGPGYCSTGGRCTVPLGSSGPTMAESTTDPFICAAGALAGSRCNTVCSTVATPCTVNADCASNSCVQVGCVGGSCSPASMSHVSCTGFRDCQKAICGRCSNNANRPCNTNGQCTGGGTCHQAVGARDGCDLGVNNWCWHKPAWDAPSCPGGWCGQSTQQAYVQRTLTAISDALAARTGAQATEQVWVLPADPGPAFQYGWGCRADDFRAQRNWLREWAPPRGHMYVDTHSRFFRLSPAGRVADAVADFVHWKPEWQVHAADLVMDCALGEPGEHTCTGLYVPCEGNGDCAGQANTVCREWPGTTDQFCLRGQ